MKEQTTGQTKFEQDLQIYFPDLYKFWSLFAFDPHYELVLMGILEAVDTNMHGKLVITYQNGKINYCNITKELTAHKSHKPKKRLTNKQ